MGTPRESDCVGRQARPSDAPKGRAAGDGGGLPCCPDDCSASPDNCLSWSPIQGSEGRSAGTSVGQVSAQQEARRDERWHGKRTGMPARGTPNATLISMFSRPPIPGIAPPRCRQVRWRRLRPGERGWFVREEPEGSGVAGRMSSNQGEPSWLDRRTAKGSSSRFGPAGP